jgi:hypothetical protein
MEWDEMGSERFVGKGQWFAQNDEKLTLHVKIKSLHCRICA